MMIFVDADACPVTKIAEQIARRHGIEITLLCDTNHVLRSDYARILVIDAGADSVDFALVNRCNKGDIVITQDYGVAAMALSKGAHAVHQSGMLYTPDNIDSLLEQRYVAKKIRMSSAKSHLRGPSKRTAEDDKRFADAFEKLIADLES